MTVPPTPGSVNRLTAVAGARYCLSQPLVRVLCLPYPLSFQEETWAPPGTPGDDPRVSCPMLVPGSQEQSGLEVGPDPE